MNVEYETNQVVISGVVIDEPVPSHSVIGEQFYSITLEVARTSGNADYLPVIVSERLPKFAEIKEGKAVKVWGQYRSHNKHDEAKSKLVLNVFARDIDVSDDIYDLSPSGPENSILALGYVCKQPVFRKTPLGREIADILIAVNRSYGKSDYIPCICWGRNASYAASAFNVGDPCSITGRIQSRVYNKRIDDNTTEERVAYEVSVLRIDKGHNTGTECE